jgi:hypothetical protein
MATPLLREKVEVAAECVERLAQAIKKGVRENDDINEEDLRSILSTLRRARRELEF